METSLGSLRTQYNDERVWEVGQSHSTEEVAEQYLQASGGGNGGKGIGQREFISEQRIPDTGPDTCAKRSGADTSSSSQG